MDAVFEASVRMLAEEIIERTPVADGDLPAPFRASASPIAMVRAGTGSFDERDMIDGITAGGTVHLGFAAPYAAAVEFGTGGADGHGMLRLAAQNWADIVEQAIRETPQG
jgi:hypothetical protein